MIRFRKSTVGAAATLAALMLLPAPGFAAGEHDHAQGEAAIQKAPEDAKLAHMGKGAQADGANMMAPGQVLKAGHGTGSCQGAGMTGSGMVKPGMMGSNMMGSNMMGSGMMGSNMMGAGMMGSNMMGRDMMASVNTMPDMMGPGMTAPGNERGHGTGMGSAAELDQDLSIEDVRARLDRSLARHGNKRLEVGEITETDGGAIIAEIVTKDGSLVRRLEVDRRTGQMHDVE